jgi:hypothetical protein
MGKSRGLNYEVLYTAPVFSGHPRAEPSYEDLPVPMESMAGSNFKVVQPLSFLLKGAKSWMWFATPFREKLELMRVVLALTVPRILNRLGAKLVSYTAGRRTLSGKRVTVYHLHCHWLVKYFWLTFIHEYLPCQKPSRQLI